MIEWSIRRWIFETDIKLWCRIEKYTLHAMQHIIHAQTSKSNDTDSVQILRPTDFLGLTAWNSVPGWVEDVNVVLGVLFLLFRSSG